VVEERLAELRLVHTIFVKTPPHTDTFSDIESIPKDAETWASDKYGLKIQGLNGLDELLDLVAEEDYTVGPVDDDGSPDIKTVTVWLKDRTDIKTEFRISLSKLDPADGVVNMGGLYYKSLQEAVDASKGTEGTPDRIFVLKDLTIDSKITIPSGKHVLLVPMYGKDDITLTRGDGFDGSLFTVENGASLTLAGSGLAKLVIDGGKGKDYTASKALITVDGTLTMNSGVKLQNNKNTSGAGGGVNVASNGTFTMTGGTISGNTATTNGGGLYVTSGTFTMSGGTVYGSDADNPALKNTAPNGAAAWINSTEKSETFSQYS
jgi:predicted outer membrane repeat protein